MGNVVHISKVPVVTLGASVVLALGMAESLRAQTLFIVSNGGGTI